MKGLYLIIMGLTLFTAPQVLTFIISKYFKINLTDGVKISSKFYLLLAGLLPILFLFVPDNLIHLRWVNFLQHGIGGGVAVGLVCLYFISIFEGVLTPFLIKEGWGGFCVRFIFVFATVSMLGVINELLEFALDFVGIGIYSADRYDTWYDLLANTTGAISIFLIFTMIKKFINLCKSK
jgi:hypothetical protein